MNNGEDGPPPLVLASASRSRAAILRNAGLPFETEPATIDEAAVKESLKAEDSEAEDAVLALAELKAARVCTGHPGSFVIGADQILVCDDIWFDKPPGLNGARQHLQDLRGKTHELVSAVCVMRDGALLWRHAERARLTMRPFSDSFLDHYLEAEGSAVCESVGAYRLEGMGAQLFSNIEGDHFTILGLPLLPLLDFLRGHGVVEE